MRNWVLAAAAIFTACVAWGADPATQPAHGQANGPPPVSFMGIQDNANSVIFVCDDSGSMLTKFDALRAELRSTNAALQPRQRFNVFFFAEAEGGKVDKELLPANPGNRRKVLDGMNGVGGRGGETHPEPALEAAFALHPQMIILLTDGDFPNNQSAIDTVQRLHAADKSVRVNTIAFIDRGEEYEKTLQQMATDTGGTFHYVSARDIKP